MSLEALETRAELADLVATFANLADENRIDDQKALFTPDAHVEIWIGDHLLFDVSGADTIAKTFADGTAAVTRSFHMLGQQSVQVDGDRAAGTVYCQVKLVTVEDGVDTVADSSIRYEDVYERRIGRWLIATRISRFTIVDRRTLSA